jgi:hypothetical protein
MQIFNLPNGPLVDDKKMIKEEWQKTFSDFWQQAQRELGTEGFLIPQQPTSTVDTKTGVVNIGLLMYDTDRKALVINIDGALYKIDVTAL